MRLKRKDRFKSEHDINQYYKIILSHLVRMPSISNPSINSYVYTEEGEHKVERTPSLILEETVREQILEQFLKDHGLKRGDISVACIEELTPILKIMEENRFTFSLNYIKKIDSIDQTFMDKFEKFATKKPLYSIKNETHSLEYRAIAHTIYTVGFKEVIFKLFVAEEFDRLSDIYNLITLSHLIMGVRYEDIHAFIISQLKYLLTNDFIADEQLGYCLYYAEITGNLHNKFMLYHLEKKYEENEVNDNDARKNYRSMKVWRTLVRSVKRLISKDLKRLDEYSYEVALHQDEKNHDDDDDNCCLIRWLKKGYKYKVKQKHEFKKASKSSHHNSKRATSLSQISRRQVEKARRIYSKTKRQTEQQI